MSADCIHEAAIGLEFFSTHKPERHSRVHRVATALVTTLTPSGVLRKELPNVVVPLPFDHVADPQQRDPRGST